MGILLWVLLIGIVVFFFVLQRRGKKQYADRDLSVDENWLENSLARYPADDTVYQYYLHPDTNYTHQGHILEDRSGAVIYEEQVLYNSVTAPNEEDFVNHLIGYTHHHKLGHTTTVSAGGENVRFNVDSTFRFDGVSIWEYLRELGCECRIQLHGLAYSVEVTRDGTWIGSLYSSNQGKNYYDAVGPIVPRLGSAGCLVVECRNCDLDYMMLAALAYVKTEFNPHSVHG